MKVTEYQEVPPVVMESDLVKNVAGRVMIGKADGAENFCMRIFEIGPDGFTPRHTHEWEHEIFVHKGNAAVYIKDKWYPLSAGSTVFIPGNVEHQLKNTGDETFTFVCLIPSGAPEL